MSIGTVAQGVEQFENKLIVLEPAGSVALEHYRYGGQMFEPFKPGDGVLRTVDMPFGRLSGVICWDTDFQGTMRQAGRNGTDLLLSPSLEWRGIDPCLHRGLPRDREWRRGRAPGRQS
jgi:apolipoprotein N-acyltransferase